MTKGSDRTSAQKSITPITCVLTRAMFDPCGWTSRIVCFTLRRLIVLPLLDDDEGDDDDNDDGDGDGDGGDDDDDD